MLKQKRQHTSNRAQRQLSHPAVVRRLPTTPPRQPPPQRTGRRRPALWYALYLINPQGSELLASLAQHCQQISDHISLDGEDAMVLEIGSSLRYFGSLLAIRKQIDAALAQTTASAGVETHVHHAVSPSASASLLLARSGRQLALRHEQDLRSQLGSIPTDAMAVSPKIRNKLKKCGLFYLRDIWRLPVPELRIRFGRDLSDYLQQCLAQKPEPRARWQQDISYRDCYEAENGLYSLAQIVCACETLLERFETFLRRHHVSSDLLTWMLDYGHGEPEIVTIQVRKPERDARLFLLLLETRLASISLRAEVYRVSLQAEKFSAHVPDIASWHAGGADTELRNNTLLEQLAARLGDHGVHRLLLRRDYCPEFATRSVPYLESPAEDEYSLLASLYTPAAPIQNPCWLLKPPQAISVRNNQLYYQSAVTLLRGPRRIETRWWEDQGIRRDYYIAANEQGTLLWIFQDLSKKNRQAPAYSGWFLHGLFA